MLIPLWSTDLNIFLPVLSIVCGFAFNSLAPGKFLSNLRHVIFKQILVIDGWGISCEIALIWMSLNLPNDKSTLDQVMAWCRQATSHYLSQCWPRSMSPNGVTMPQGLKALTSEEMADVLQTMVSFFKENFRLLVKISLKFVHIVPVDNELALVRVLNWYQTGDKPLPEPMLILFTDTSVHLQPESSF